MDDESDPAWPTQGKRRARKTAATIYDVARLAGVGPSSVSRALREPGRMSAETERRVHEAAKQLGYQANPAAQTLHTGRTNTFAMIVADLTSPVFFEIVRGAQRASQEMGYALVYAEHHESGEDELTIAERHVRTVDGIVLAMSGLADEQIVALAERTPVVVINRLVPSVPGVVADIDHGVGEVVRHLAGLGHRSIAYLAGPADSWMSERRWQCLQDRCASSSISVRKIQTENPTVLGGRKATEALRESGTTAAVAFNDLVAIGLMRELHDTGVAIPDQLSVVGFDDIFGADFITPALTSVTAPLSELGAQAFHSIFAQVNGTIPTHPETERALLTRLVVRESTGPARR